MMVIRWTARILSILILTFHAMSFFGDLPMANLTTSDYMNLGLWVLVMLGMIIAWKWEVAGGLLIIAVFVVQVNRNPMVLSMWAFWIAPLTGALFLISWMISRKKNEPGTKTA